MKPRTVETLPDFKWKFGALNYQEQTVLAREIDRMARDEPVRATERVAGTKRLHRLRSGEWRLLYVSEAGRILLVTLERGRRPPTRRRP